MEGRDIVKLAAEFAAGSISADHIKSVYGEGVLSSVLALSGGALTGIATGALLDLVDRETGIVSDVGSLVDDVLDLF
jgi:hypothetical protein